MNKWDLVIHDVDSKESEAIQSFVYSRRIKEAKLATIRQTILGFNGVPGELAHLLAERIYEALEKA
jgi:hypothetical protein